MIKKIPFLEKLEKVFSYNNYIIEKRDFWLLLEFTLMHILIETLK